MLDECLEAMEDCVMEDELNMLLPRILRDLGEEVVKDEYLED